jgi:TetR/AcrR family transcriptional regulator, cholesterol catabolism regulator
MTREEQKRATRAKVLAAARKLFAIHGYEATTVRMIASEAGCAVGGVFTTFESKEEILFEIAAERYDALAQAIMAEANGPGTVRDKMKRGFTAAFDFEFERIGLLMVQIGASWTWSHEFEAKSQARLAAPFSFIGKLLGEARAKGEMRADADLALLGDLLLGIYLRTWRHAWYRKLNVAAAGALAGRQIDLVFEGAKA